MKKSIEYKTTILGGVTLLVEIETTHELDEFSESILSGRDCFSSPAAYAEYLKSFQDGERELRMITVTAKAIGLMGSDHLGGVVCMADTKDQEVSEIIKEYGMEQNAIDELRSEIVNKANRLKYFVGAEV